jgi:hypothetical protein
MEPHVRENWKKIQEALEAAGKTDCMFYRRAQNIARGGEDLEVFKHDPEQKSD